MNEENTNVANDEMDTTVGTNGELADDAYANVNTDLEATDYDESDDDYHESDDDDDESEDDEENEDSDNE